MATGKDLTAFRTLYDRDANEKIRIEIGLKQLGDSWEYIGEFLKRIGFSTSQWGRHKEQYSAVLVAAPRIDRHGGLKAVITGTAAFATKLRAQLAK